jgi:hypothetical protein
MACAYGVSFGLMELPSPHGSDYVWFSHEIAPTFKHWSSVEARWHGPQRLTTITLCYMNTLNCNWRLGKWLFDEQVAVTAVRHELDYWKYVSHWRGE